ncbi:AAA family ATPase [Candidatus Woesearchaeota archaeon]|nr:AAA family ATPase [Candidatus Woesearchaeota archaeon]
MSWFATLGFKDNPLDIRPNPTLVGLNNEFDKVRNHILKEEICFLNGLTGSGKTSMLKKLQKELKNHKFIYLDAHDLPKDFSLEQELSKKRGFFDRITLKKFPTKQPVLIIDEFQDTDKNIVLQARSSWENPNIRKIRSIVIAQISPRLLNVTDSFKERLGNRMVRLRSLDDEELKTMLSTRLDNKKEKTNFYKKLSPETVDLLIEVSGGNPRRLLEYADLIFDFHHRKFKEHNPVLNDDYKISYHGAKEILDYHNIVVVEQKVAKSKTATAKGIGAFERLYNPIEQKVLRYLLNTGASDYLRISRATKISMSRLRTMIPKLKKKGGVKDAGIVDRRKLFDITPKAKRLTVKV